MNKEEKEKLEKIAEHHISPPKHHQVDVKVQRFDLKKMYKFIEGPNILEMGYGDGLWTEENIKTFGKTYIVDASQKLLETVKGKYGEKVTCYNSFFEDFECPDGIKFNTIVASHILEHVKDPVKVLLKAKNWLAENGQIIVIVPNAESFHRQLAVLMGIQNTIYDFSKSDHEVGHVRVYDIELLREDIRNAGFKIFMERGLFLKILPNGMMTEFSDKLIESLVEISDSLPSRLMANLAMIIKPANTNL